MSSATPTSPRSASGRTEDRKAAINAIRRLLRALRVAAHKTQAQTGISAAQLFMLQALDAGSPASISQLAERTMTDRSSVTGVVERLIDAKLASRTPAPDDKRRAEIRITLRGRHRLQQAPSAPTALLLAGINQLSAGELSALADGLRALCRVMQIDGGEAGMLFDDAPPRAPRAARAKKAANA